MSSRPHHRWIALTLMGAVTILLFVGHRQIGYTRDEGIYFEASRSYARWIRTVVHNPAALGDHRLRDRRFSVNHEHPALMKIVAGTSGLALARAPQIETDDAKVTTGLWPILREGAAMRLPAQLLAGLGAALLFLAAARRYGTCAGLLAAGWVYTLPRVWFHAGLHAFDVPIMVAILAVVLSYRRALESPRWAVACGVLLGVAIAIKHNALFVAPLLALHLWLSAYLQRERSTDPPRSTWPEILGRCLPAPLWSMAIVSPLVAWALWPWLWTDPVPRLQEYLTFHAQHNWYNMEFLGTNYNQPPMPFSYPWVMTWATVPTTLLSLALVGLFLRRDPNREKPCEHSLGFWRPLRDPTQSEGLLWLLLSLAPLLLIALPQTPIFGGTKHWLTAYPFLALASAGAWAWIWRRAHPPRCAWLEPLALALVLAPSTWSTVAGHPYQLSQYAPMLGPKGAADLGLNRGFWGHAVLPLLADLEDPTDSPLCPGDMHALAKHQYARDGTWPRGIELGGFGQCHSALHHYEAHMTTYEVTLWNTMGTTVPDEVLTLHDVPLTSLYRAVKPTR